MNLGIFEAIVWSAGDSLYPRGFDVQYLNPVIFYRPVEFAIGSPDNALLGGALNVRAGRSTTLYLQVMLDEFLLEQVRSGNGWYANKQAVQGGSWHATRSGWTDWTCAANGTWSDRSCTPIPTRARTTPISHSLSRTPTEVTSKRCWSTSIVPRAGGTGCPGQHGLVGVG
ncbi:MAG: hypothetical protein IPN62_16725 [Flavobacteriales bacterium]|nr:hypothetical protein [Flavobacteriales bacterium]